MLAGRFSWIFLILMVYMLQQCYLCSSVCVVYVQYIFYRSKLIIFLLVKAQHRTFIYITTWGLWFFPWLLPKLMVTLSCSVPGLPLWPEAQGGELWRIWPHVCAVWFDCRCGDRETAQIMALPLHLWRKFPVPLCTWSLDRLSLAITLRPLHQVTLCSPSLIFPMSRGQQTDGGSGPVGWVDGAPGSHSCCRNCSIVDSSQPAYQSISCLFKCSGEHLKNLPSKQPALFLLRF